MPNTRSKARTAVLREKTVTSSKLKPSAKDDKSTSKRCSIRILEKKQSLESNKKGLDVYEFTYDPKEEPQTPKKKRKKVAKKRQPKPKNFVMKYYYDNNISKAMTSLKNVIKKIKQKQDVDIINTTTLEQNNEKVTNSGGNNNSIDVSTNCVIEKQTEPQKINTSIQVEDIAADFETTCDNHTEINYSPMASPNRTKSPDNQPSRSIRDKSLERGDIVSNDPLNLRDDLSFFDDQPVANSSMNTSVRHPLASPWRVEFNDLPIKWQVNTYVKPDMTPAVESSFINFDDNKKKHVYTNMVPESNEALPEIIEKDSPNKIQTSIISFIKEVVEKKANKKRAGSVKPNKTSNIFENVNYSSVNENIAQKTSRILATPKKNTTTNSKTPNKSNSIEKISTNNENEENHNKHEYNLFEHSTPNKNANAENVSNNNENLSEDKENSKKLRKRKNKSDPRTDPAKTPRKNKGKNISYFGFDDSENQEQENVSPVKNIDTQHIQTLRPRTRAILRDINAQIGPTRAALPAMAARSKIAPSSQVMSKHYDNMKPATDAPVLSKNITEKNVKTTNVSIPTFCGDVNNEDSQSVHLFEDIEVVHHMKPTRKSYGNNKKVVIRTRSTSDSDIQDLIEEEHVNSDDEEDLQDLSFRLPSIKPKRATKKKNPKHMMSKKEEQEAEAWAAKFNSMCEDVDEFPLLVE